MQRLRCAPKLEFDVCVRNAVAISWAKVGHTRRNKREEGKRAAIRHPKNKMKRGSCSLNLL